MEIHQQINQIQIDFFFFLSVFACENISHLSLASFPVSGNFSRIFFLFRCSSIMSFLNPPTVFFFVAYIVALSLWVLQCFIIKDHAVNGHNPKGTSWVIIYWCYSLFMVITYQIISLWLINQRMINSYWKLYRMAEYVIREHWITMLHRHNRLTKFINKFSVAYDGNEHALVDVITSSSTQWNVNCSTWIEYCFLAFKK